MEPITREWLVEQGFGEDVEVPTHPIYYKNGLHLTMWATDWKIRIGGANAQWHTLYTPTRDFVQSVITALTPGSS